MPCNFQASRAKGLIWCPFFALPELLCILSWIVLICNACWLILFWNVPRPCYWAKVLKSSMSCSPRSRFSIAKNRPRSLGHKCQRFSHIVKSLQNRKDCLLLWPLSPLGDERSRHSWMCGQLQSISMFGESLTMATNVESNVQNNMPYISVNHFQIL